MRKHEMVRAIARGTSITYSQALAAIDTLTTLIIETVARGERVTLRDLGYFDSRELKGRTVKNKFLDDAFSISLTGPRPSIQVANSAKQSASDYKVGRWLKSKTARRIRTARLNNVKRRLRVKVYAVVGRLTMLIMGTSGGSV